MRRWIVVASFFFFALGVVWRQVFAQTLLVDEYGRTYVEDGQVLGKEGSDDSSGSSGSGSSGSGSSGSSNTGSSSTSGSSDSDDSDRSGTSGSGSSGSSSTTAPQVTPTPTRFESRVEIRSDEGRLRLETRSDEGGVRFEQETRTAGGVKRIRIKDGKLEIRVKPPEEEVGEDEIEEEATESALFARIRVREHVSENEVELEAEGNEVRIRHRGFAALTGFPLSLGSNNELLVTTPAGTKEVAVLPDEAVSHLLQNGILTSTAAAELSSTATTSAGLGGELELEDENGVLVYKVKGTKKIKLLGVVPVTVEVGANVSAETGAVVSLSQPWYFNLFGFLFRP